MYGLMILHIKSGYHRLLYKTFIMGDHRKTRGVAGAGPQL
jgi:hypothetical protein